MSGLPEGFEVPVHRSLTGRILIGGLPRTAAFVLWTTAAALALGMRQLWVVPIGASLHAAMAAATRHDPFFLDVFVRALKTPPRMEP